MTDEPQESPPSEARNDRLLAMASRWGMTDDYERELAIDEATDAERAELAHSLDEVHPRFWEWLAGPESLAVNPSDVYRRMSALVMAVDAARQRSGLADRGGDV